MYDRTSQQQVYPYASGASCFTDKERDSESGLDYFDARYYSSSMGRFSSPDDGSAWDLTNPQSLNLYSYVLNNPLINTDPDGHTCQTNSSDITIYDDMDGKGCAAVDQQNKQRLKDGIYESTVNGGGSSSLETTASNVGGYISNAASSTMNFVSQVGSQLSNIAQTPGGIGCMANAAGAGAMAGMGAAAAPGLVGLAAGGGGVLITEPSALAIGGVGGGLSGAALGMTVCPGGAMAMSRSGAGGGGRQAASEKTAKDMGKQIEKDLGPAARREFHDEKMGGGGDRTLEELKADAQTIYEQYGRTPPRWMQ